MKKKKAVNQQPVTKKQVVNKPDKKTPAEPVKQKSDVAEAITTNQPAGIQQLNEEQVVVNEQEQDQVVNNAEALEDVN